MKKGKRRQGFIYSVFRAYLRFVHDRFFYRRVYYKGKENIPADGTPVLIVSNHQNCLCDPLGVMFAFKDRKLGALVRADVFDKHPIVNRILRKMGLLPAYRLTFDGEESLGRNKEIFSVSGKELVDGRTILIYPEGAHQDKHWLGDFTFGYTKMAFEAAEIDDFQTEIFILPCCNHYSGYYDIQNDYMIKFGVPVSIKPFYELYKTKPRTAQRQVNTVIREQMNGMMLNITDLSNYKVIDFLRNTYGRKYAASQGLNVDNLTDLLQSDRDFFEKMDKAGEENNLFVQQVYDDALRLENELERLKIRDENLDYTPGWGYIIMSLIAFVVLFPVWLFSLWPNIIIYKLPDLAMLRVKDKMFYNSFLYAMSAVITMPVLYTLSFVLVWVYVNIWVAVIYLLFLPFLGLFAWYYRKYFVRTMRNIYFHNIQRETICEVRRLREMIYERLNKILYKK